jgi:hypothetical protein|tara:strand:+ start:83 stop:829 length:747 start_codon:yes stop_codon:yes gene_type:complete
MNKSQIVAASVSAGTSAMVGIYALHKANKARGDQVKLNDALNTLEQNRQQIINPYANVSNQYANLGVATQAAEFQAEQTDIALANTLDTIRQTGAGGATALAQAALQSKKGISASLEQQELANEQLRARGAMETQKLKAMGEVFKFEKQEERELQKLDRLQAQIDQERQNEVLMRASAINSFTDLASNFSSLAAGAGGSISGGTTGSSMLTDSQIAQAFSSVGSGNTSQNLFQGSLEQSSTPQFNLGN